ncbi:MAG: hypothetical protein RMX68_016730 [Aulosira sp. ZfuVER01]|nr:hypothetical protein [Aulosira sp. ZfuVER01]MDZ8000816.1 hypothetical protein [Aulosira sp. DedVER01a]MDZ8055913.1 hypothetical protein [Aulosira sp. ZfuCHP01]
MSEEFISFKKIVELHEEELNAVAGGKDVSISSSYSQEDVKFVSQSPTDSVIKSVNKITTALHLITISI